MLKRAVGMGRGHERGTRKVCTNARTRVEGGALVKVLATQAQGSEFRPPYKCRVNAAQPWKEEAEGSPEKSD